MAKKSLYFGYGSNIWLDQMRRRCPESKFKGVGKLVGWKWIINNRGYANIIPSHHDIVYGFIYELTQSDEKKLDQYEGLGSAYDKKYVDISTLVGKDSGKEGDVTIMSYIDSERLEEGKPKDEYVYRMNMAIKDGLQEGIPKEYFDKYLRPFIPTTVT